MRGLVILFVAIFLAGLAGYLVRPRLRGLSNLLYFVAATAASVTVLAMLGVI